MRELFSFSLPGEDPLGVLTTTAPVAEGAGSVRIDPEAVELFARARAGQGPPAHAEEALHCTFLPPRRFANYLLALEALNFCFWDDAPRWRVTYRGASHDGYWALAAALHRAIREDGTPVWDAALLAEMTAERSAHLLRGEGSPVPLLEARAAHLREAGSVLLSRWEGEFANLIEECGGRAAVLVRRIVEEFPSFRDEAEWRGKRVVFYKRAQICVADLARMVPHHPLGRLEGLHRLTAFADYKVPQVLRKEGILVFAETLAERVARGEELAAGSEEEVEIRAATIWGCEWIARALARAGAPGTEPPTAAGVDYLLWSAGQDKTGLPPYHRTRTIYY
jgi:hypothetical protein